LLHGILGFVEVAEATNQDRQDPRREHAKQAFDVAASPQVLDLLVGHIACRHISNRHISNRHISNPDDSINGRISIAVYLASGIWAANSITRSFESHSSA